MNTIPYRRRRLIVMAAALAVLLPVLAGASRAGATEPTISVLTSGMENPRGLKFGPDGKLYVAEGGLGGTTSTTASQCQQVPPPIGPYTGAMTARISKIDPHSGARMSIIDGLPSSQTAPPPAAGSFVSGVADVAFLGSQLYAIMAGAGCSHGLLDTDNAVVRVDPQHHTATQVADLSAFLQAHPGAHPDPGDYEPDGTWYSLVSSDAVLYAVEPNHQQIDTITPDGHINQVIDMSKNYPGPTDWRGPTGMVRHGDHFYLVNLDPFAPTSIGPGTIGHASLWRLSEDGDLKQLHSGLTAAVGVAVHDGQIYALESFTGTFAPIPGVADNTGKVVRLNRHGGWDTVVGGPNFPLNFPTAMTFGPDGNLYISNNGFQPGQPTSSAGEILRIHLNHNTQDD
jgi:hypothetical protein